MKKGKTGVPTPVQSNDTNQIVDVKSNKRFDETKVKTEARRILKTGNPIEYILDIFNRIHIGDRKTGEVLTLSVGSTCLLNYDGTHPGMSGDSGKGKSHSCKTIAHLMPKGFVLNTSLTPKALFYNVDSIHDGMIIFSDDVEISSDMESIIKRSTSEFQQGIEHLTVINQKGKTMTMPKRIVWWLASVDNDLGMQTLNRQVSVSVDCSPETDTLVKEHQLKRARTGEVSYPETFEVEVCREIFKIVKNILVRVLVPFTDRIEWRGESNRRNLDIFLNLVACNAVFNYQQRSYNTADDGVCEITATLDDYHNAARLYLSRAKAQTNKMTTNETKIIDFLASYGSADINRIAEATGLTYNTTSRLLSGRSDWSNGGLLDKVKELQVDQVQRTVTNSDDKESKVWCKEFSMSSGYNQLMSYESVVSLTDDAEPMSVE